MPLALAPALPPARRCQYRQRDAFPSPLWRILVDHLETFVATYDSRFVDTYGPLKPYAEKAFGSLLLCGDPNLGVTRFSCCTCNTELAVPFSCKTRICPSCAKRRAEEVAANQIERLPAVGHRHLVVTIPRKAGLRLRILEDPKLFRKLAQIIVRVLRRQMVRQLSIHRDRNKEAFTPEGDFIPLWNWDTSPVSYRQLSYDEATGMVRCRSKRGGRPGPARTPTSAARGNLLAGLKIPTAVAVSSCHLASNKRAYLPAEIPPCPREYPSLTSSSRVCPAVVTAKSAA